MRASIHRVFSIDITLGVILNMTLRIAFLRVVILVVVVFLSGCNDGLPAATDVESDFRAALKLGDSAEKIEAFFQSQKLGFDFDKYQDRYQSIIRSPSTDFHAIVIFVNVDKEKRFKAIQAQDSYTWP